MLNYDIKINDTPIARVSSFDFLGLSLNENMSWKTHCDKIGNKIAKYLGVFNRLKRQIPSHILKTLYFSLIYPLLNYCINTWGYECHRIDKLHKKIIRIISCSKYNAHTEPIFKSLSILKLEDVLSLNVLKFYFKYYHSDLPEYFRCITIIERTQIHNYNTRHRFEIEEYATRPP